MTKTCRKCGTAFSDDLNTCPVCKTALIPFDPNANENVTASYAALKNQLELVSLKSRRVSSLLFLFFGFLGIGWFYLGFKNRGLIHVLSFIFVSVLFFLIEWLYLSFLFFGILQMILFMFYLFNPDAKDGRGELLK